MSAKPKRLFVSASSREAPLSTAFINHLSNAFDGTLVFSSSAQDLGAGDEWKNWIKNWLNDCDGGIFLLTPTYARSPWPSAEFTAFWLREKPIFVLLVGDIGPSDLFRPMQDDYQATHLGDVEHLRQVFRNLAQFAGKERIPFEFVELLSLKCLEAYKQCQELTAGSDQEVDPSALIPDPSTYQKRHELLSISWALARNLDTETLRGVCTREETIVCQSGVLHYIKTDVAQAANIVPFDSSLGFEVELLSSDYPGGKVALERVSYSTGQNYSFRVRFTPPLRKGSSASVRYRFTIPKLKVATVEQLREYLFQSDPDVELRNYESFVIQILDPTEKFIYEVEFDASCQIQPEQPEVSWRWGPIPREQAELLGGGYSCQEVSDGSWQMRIERQDPTVETRYTLRWKLPRQRDFEVTGDPDSSI